MSLIVWLAAISPLAYLAAAARPTEGPPQGRTAMTAAWLSLLVALGGLGYALIVGPAASSLIGVAGLGLALRLDALSGVLGVLIGFIGLVVVSYSRNYLAGDPRQGSFLRGLCLTLAAVQLLVVSGNLAQLVLCWIAVSLCVNRLLLFRGERQAAVLAARKRFLVSRASEACLVAAAILLWNATGAGDIEVILAAASASDANFGLAGLLLAVAAILSSAQLPFHGWILEVMETPTPVSALLHAGVVNAGGFLLVRFSDVLVAHPHVMSLLIIVGALTALFGSLVMLAQTSVKVALAYSTIAQMGFMLLECGLGAFAPALLHIVAHALYKAYAFLSAGGVAGKTQALATPVRRSAPVWVLVGAPVAVAAAATALAVAGEGPAVNAGGFVLTAVFALGLCRIWVEAWERGSRTFGVVAAALSLAALAAYALAQAAFERILGGIAADLAKPPIYAVAAAIVVVTLMTAMLCLQIRLAAAPTRPGWRRAYAAAANGFYLNTFANRWVLRLWPAPPNPAPAQGSR